MLSCDSMCFHKLSCLIMSYHVLSCLIMSYHAFHMLSCDNMCFFCPFWLSSHQLLNFVVFHFFFGCPAITCWTFFMAVQPPHKSLQCFLWLSSHHFFPLPWGSFPKKNLQRSQFFLLSWGSFPKKNLQRPQVFPLSWWPFPQKNLKRSQVFLLSWWSFPKKNSQEIPGFPTILVVLPQKNFSRDPRFSHYLGGPSPKKMSRDPSFSHYLGGPSPKKMSRDPRFSHYLGGPSPKKILKRSQDFPLSWWSFPKKISQEIPAFPTILVVLPQKKFSRDPSFSHYLGGPSPKKFFKRSQLFPLSWWSFPKKISPEILLFPTILGALPQKNFSRDPTFSHYLGGPSPKTFSRDPSFSHYLGCPPPKKNQGWGSHRSWGACSFLQKKTHGFPATTQQKQNTWLSSHHPTQTKQMALQPSHKKNRSIWLSSHQTWKKKPAPIFTFLFFLSVGRVPCLLRGLWLSSQLYVHQVLLVDLFPMHLLQLPQQVHFPGRLRRLASFSHAVPAANSTHGMLSVHVLELLAVLTLAEHIPVILPEFLLQHTISVGGRTYLGVLVLLGLFAAGTSWERDIIFILIAVLLIFHVFHFSQKGLHIFIPRPRLSSLLPPLRPAVVGSSQCRPCALVLQKKKQRLKLIMAI